LLEKHLKQAKRGELLPHVLLVGGEKQAGHSLGGAGKWHSLGAGEVNRATTASGVKVAKHPQGLTLTPARDGGA
jgi:hypothetical protein